jgi:hypothetical protein
MGGFLNDNRQFRHLPAQAVSLERLKGCPRGSPKTSDSDALKPTNGTLIRDIDPDVGNTLRQREQSLERGKEITGHRDWPALVAAAH